MTHGDTPLQLNNREICDLRSKIWNNKCIRGVMGGGIFIFNIILWFAWSYLKNTQPEIRIKLCIAILAVDIIAGVINYLLVTHDLTYKDKLIRMGAGSDLTGKNHMAAKICAIAYYGGLIVYTFLTFKI